MNTTRRVLVAGLAMVATVMLTSAMARVARAAEGARSAGGCASAQDPECADRAKAVLDAGRVAGLTVTVRAAAAHDVSASLLELAGAARAMRGAPVDCAARVGGCGTSPAGISERPNDPVPAGARGEGIEQRAQGARPPAVLLESFDGHGVGMVGPHGTARGGNPSDNSLAVGPNHIVETVNGGGLAVYTKRGELFDHTGEMLFGPIGVNVLFAGFGGECERAPNGDHVVRYDQLADRWLHVMPLFRRAVDIPPGDTIAPYGMCYAISTGPNPLGPYYRYYFERELFPDYPRPAIWWDGYYVPTSTGDNRLPDGTLPHKHACVLERDKVLRGLPAREQCVISRYANFYNNADIDGRTLPPPGAPNIMMATGGAQLDSVFSDDAIYWWKFHVDWEEPANTRLEGPYEIPVAPYTFLCNGQLTRCVPQPGTDMRLDAQGDKLMQRLVYRNVAGVQSIVAVHSVATAAGGGGVRWYEFRLNERFEPVLHQQGTYAPDSLYRWLPSAGMDRQGNIGIGYSFGGASVFAGQRFAGRLADDPPGELTLQETVLIEGAAAQTSTLRWEDYVTLALDPSDDCTMWYVGDYLKAGATSYTTRIGAFRLPGCLRGQVSGTTYFDVNHNGMREANEPALPGREVEYAGAHRPHDRLAAPAGRVVTDSLGEYRISLPADPAYFEPVYAFRASASATAAGAAQSGLTLSGGGIGYWSGGTVPMTNGGYTVRLRDRDEVTRIDFGFSCTVVNTGGRSASYWLGKGGRALLAANHAAPAGRSGRSAGARGRGGPWLPGWRGVLSNAHYLVAADGARLLLADSSFSSAYAAFISWLRGSARGDVRYRSSGALAVTVLNLAYGGQAGNVTVRDPVVGDWPMVAVLAERISTQLAGDTAAAEQLEQYRAVLEQLNENTALVTPALPGACPRAH